MALFWHFLFSAVCSSDKKVILWMYHTQSGMDSKRTIPFFIASNAFGLFPHKRLDKNNPHSGRKKGGTKNE